MSQELEARLEQEEEEAQKVANAIQQTEANLEVAKNDFQQRIGKITLLRELLGKEDSEEPAKEPEAPQE